MFWWGRSSGVLPDSIDRSSESFANNSQAMGSIIYQLHSNIRQLMEGGGETAVKRNRSRNKLLPRKRIGRLIDPGFSFLELSRVGSKAETNGIAKSGAKIVVAGSCAKMDWQGQKLAEHLVQILLVVSAVVAFLVGYILGSFQIMLMIYGAGVLMTFLITVPNWPFFNRHPLNWLDPSEAEKHPKLHSTNATSKKKSGKK